MYCFPEVSKIRLAITLTHDHFDDFGSGVTEKQENGRCFTFPFHLNALCYSFTLLTGTQNASNMLHITRSNAYSEFNNDPFYFFLNM